MTNAKIIAHQVKEGEGLSSIALQYGFAPHTLWGLPENADLRRRRPHADTLMPGDVVYVPPKTPGTVDRLTDATHRFRRRGVPAQVRLQLFLNGKPRAEQAYELVIDDTIHIAGRTDKDGVLTESVSPAAKRGVLTIGEDKRVMRLALGRMHPISEISGVQKRLINLRLLAGPSSGRLDDATIAALQAFQAQCGLRVTGQPCDQTRARLVEWHDARGGAPKQDAGG